MVPALTQRLHGDNGIIYYNRDHALLSEKIAIVLGDSLARLQDFYESSFSPFVHLYLYPTLEGMEEAFGRKLPHDQCCFVPLKGNAPIITFTAKIHELSLCQVITHELSHVFFAELTGCRETGRFQQSVPVWLDEGMALWRDREFRGGFKETRTRRLVLLQQSNPEEAPWLSAMYAWFNRLDDGEEFGPKGRVAYALSYFCVEELMNRFGRRIVLPFFRTLKGPGDFNERFKAHFSLSLEEFNKEIIRSLWKL